ncbi:MAG: C4-type zinc ribbon domain-containing protein [Propionicimonas sp.]|uniref:zinc ribbon domain-containing protein n=1 Tax=Propionicimonas sp. TaxID=1955623 RepID=UPI002B2057BD|nr:C4-type zinc ribbon domain-containing protein [Propionicimonas sp.]MEA4944261.1 C4-type zinc ribbon domain-containing protein [Propionicimonas sp.]MEA5054277.1 C4-type zinc ribbon domain-containing protein [Propionicimonas sp.]
MKAAPAAQLGLLDLQAVDTTIAQVEHRRKSLPEHAQIAQGQKIRAELGAAIVAAKTVVGDLELEVEKAEADLVPVKERQARDQRRLDEGVVTDPKQLSALIEEIDHLKRRISDLEDVQLEAMEKLEEATARHTELVEQRAEGEQNLRALIAARDEQVAALDAELAQQRTARDQLAAGLPDDLVTLYRKIAERSGGVGVGRLQGRRCGGCQLEATASALAGYQAAPADDVVRCEECDRILVRADG